VAAPEFFGCRGTDRAPEFRLGNLQKYAPSLFLVKASSYTTTVSGDRSNVAGKKVLNLYNIYVTLCLFII